jgi:hypothetical protein
MSKIQFMCSSRMWSGSQQHRLAVEKQLLEKHFRSVRWQYPTSRGATKVDVDFNTNVGGRYTLRLHVPVDFPNSCPSLSIVYTSKELKKRNGYPLPTLSNEFHTLGKVDGCYTICHFLPSKWDANNTMYLVFLKGRLWLEAFENHLKTGHDIDHYLKHM